MRVLIRADASELMGSGHIMRCMTLAKALRNQSAEVIFVCREHAGNLCDLIEKNDFRVLRLKRIKKTSLTNGNESYQEWLGCSSGKDASEVMEAVANFAPFDLLIIDHYALGADWETRFRSVGKKVMAIDDLANRLHDCDILLDQNLRAESKCIYDRFVPLNCKKLIGPSYALLRPEFSSVRKRMRTRDGIVRRVLVFFGGADPSHETSKTLEAIRRLGFSNFSTDVVIGSANVHCDEIMKDCMNMRGAVVHKSIDNMAELMERADLAIGASGATTWERCCLGLPSLVMTIAANQESIAKGAEKAGGLIYLGKNEDVSANLLSGKIRDLMHDKPALIEISRRAATLVDGVGTDRTLEAIEEVMCG